MDITNKVKTLYAADTSQAKAAVQSLRGAERERAKEVLNNLDAENAKLEASLKTWAKVGVAVGVAAGAYALLHKTHKMYLEDVRLESAAAGVNVSRLQEATRGLVEEDKLLEFAGRTKAGMWKLNQAEMEKVLRGAMAIRKETGEELVPIIDRLTESLAKGNTRALKEFGIEAKDKAGVVDHLAGRFEALHGSVDLAGDAMERSAVKGADAFDNLGGALGRLADKLAPAAEALADFIDNFTRGIDIIGGDNPLSRDQQRVMEAARFRARAAGNYDAFTEAGGDAGDWQELGGVDSAQLIIQAKEIERQLRFEYASRAVDAKNQTLLESNIRMVDMGVDFVNKEVDAALTKARAQAKKTLATRARGGKGEGGGPAGGITSDYLSHPGGGFGADFEGIGGGIGAGGIDLIDASGVPQAGQQAIVAREMAKANKMLAEAESQRQRRNLFETVFGTPDEITATATALGLAHAAVEGLSGAIASSFEAWVTGAESSGEVFRRMIAGVVHSMGVELAQVGAKHLILAAVDAATLNFPGAAMHTGAAAIAFGGSAAMFKIASGMGYGKAAPSTASAGAGGGAGAAVGGGYQGAGGRGGTPDQTTIIYLAPDWSDETPTQRKQRLARAVREGAVTRTSNVVLHR